MKTASLIENIEYKEDKPAISVLLKTESTKEIRIVMKAGQIMKEHKAPFPIVIEVFEGALNLGVKGEKKLLKKGDLIALDANVPHNLNCVKNCTVRLSISIADGIKRIQDLV